MLNGEPLAWHFGFLHQNVLHWYKPTYRKEYANLSPAKFCLQKVFENGIQQNWSCIDYGPGMEPYKLQWANASFDVFRWEWRRNSNTNRILNFARRAKDSTRALSSRFFASNGDYAKAQSADILPDRKRGIVDLIAYIKETGNTPDTYA